MGRESMEITLQKLQKQIASQSADKSNENMVISSRNDPKLQNLLDSMRFIINKLKKENQSLKNPSNKVKGQHSLRINNLLKENRQLKKKLDEMNESGRYEDNGYLTRQIDQKQLEIERITN